MYECWMLNDSSDFSKPFSSIFHLASQMKNGFMANITTLSVFSIIRIFPENNEHFYSHKLISPFMRETYSLRKAIFFWNSHLPLMCPSSYYILVNGNETRKELQLLYFKCKLIKKINIDINWHHLRFFIIFFPYFKLDPWI